MQAFEAAADELRSRIGVLSGKRDTAQTTLDRAQERLQAILCAGDLSDDTLLEKAQDDVDRASSRLRGITSALAALQSQLSDVTQKIVAERNASARSEASDRLRVQIDAVDRVLAPYLTSANDLAAALDALHWHFEATEMARFVRGNAGQVEVAAGLALSELRSMTNMIRDGTARNMRTAHRCRCRSRNGQYVPVAPW